LSYFSVFAVANFEVSFAREVAVGAGRSSTEQDLGLVFLAVGGTCVDLETKVSKALVDTGGPELEFGAGAEEHARVSSAYSVLVKGKLSLVVTASSSASGVNAGSLSGRAVEGWSVRSVACFSCAAVL
jgi:hypothetical protein